MITSYRSSVRWRNRRPSSTSTATRGSRGSSNHLYAASTTSGSSSTVVISTSPKSRKSRFCVEPPPSPTIEDLLRVRVVGETEMEVVAVGEPRPHRVVEVHPALERAVEAEIARVLVVDDEEAVVARVACVADGEAGTGERHLGGVELAGRPDVALPVERRPVLRRRALEHAPGGVGRERADREERYAGCRDERHARNPEAARAAQRPRPQRGAPSRPRRAPGRCRTRGRARTPSRTCRRCCPRSRSRTAFRRRCRAARSTALRAGLRSVRPTQARRSSARRG